MTASRFQDIASRYPSLRIAVVGDFCLDRYLEIDPAKQEISIETGLPVYNVVNVRSQPGAAGTILNNLAALGIGEIYPVGFCGTDGEGFELQRALRARGSAVRLDHFFATGARRTFTYCKPLLMHAGQSPQELSRLDSKNWTPTPALVHGRIAGSISDLAAHANAFILLDQVDIAETGVVTTRVMEAVNELARRKPDKLIMADSRRGLRGWPPVSLKMNAAELYSLAGTNPHSNLAKIQETALALAERQGKHVFVTLSERGIVGAFPNREPTYVPALPLRGEVDIVGAGDSVTANLTAALAAGATMSEAVEIANVAASIVIHELGTTGTASVPQIAALLPDS